jgi:hypothetical protein
MEVYTNNHGNTMVYFWYYMAIIWGSNGFMRKNNHTEQCIGSMGTSTPDFPWIFPWKMGCGFQFSWKGCWVEKTGEHMVDFTWVQQEKLDLMTEQMWFQDILSKKKRIYVGFDNDKQGFHQWIMKKRWFKRETWDLTNNGDSTNRNGDVVGIFGSFLFIPTIPSGND